MTNALASLSISLIMAAGMASPQAPDSSRMNEPGQRTKAEWTALRDAKFAVPPGQTAFGLLGEMSALIGSPDPFLRDNVTYEAVAKWIYTDKLLSAGEQRAMLARWTENLREGIGESGNDRSFLRSFSALNLSIVAARDNVAPFLSQAEYDAFLDATLGYLAAERDTRGYDGEKGWIHAAAHTADVMKFLARSPKLTADGQKRLLAAIDAKAGSFGQTFQWAEDERLALVLVSLAARADFDKAAFDAWLATIPPRRAALWANAPAIDPAKFPEVQNLTLILRAAHAALSLAANAPPQAVAARASMLETLRALR